MQIQVTALGFFLTKKKLQKTLSSKKAPASHDAALVWRGQNPAAIPAKPGQYLFRIYPLKPKTVHSRKLTNWYPK